MITSKIGQVLTPEQQTYLVRLATLNENAMAMRQVLGAGQGSDDVRRAIRATIPNAATPSKSYAFEQLDRFEKVLDRLGRGVLKVPLRGEKGKNDVVPKPRGKASKADSLREKYGIGK